MVGAAANLLVGRERNPDRAVSDVAMCLQMLDSSDDLCDSSLVVGSKQRKTRRRDDRVACLRRERRILRCPEHRGRVIRENQVPSIVVTVDDRPDIVPRHLRGRIHVRDEPDDRRLLATGRRRHGGHHVAVLIHHGVVQSERL